LQKGPVMVRTASTVVGWPALRLTATFVAALACAVAPLVGAPQQGKNDSGKQEWISLFNGKNLDGWTPKFAKHDLGENFNDTFRVNNGILEVRYDKWTRFDGEFGHM